MAGFKQIKIFTDTNIIHAAQAHLLISTAIHKYVLEHKKIESVELNWYLPSAVIEERQHQMLNAALALSPKINELEKLLGHSLAITADVMEDRVKSKIHKTIEELGLKICELDTSTVNWEELIERSVRRKPPFEISLEKEKGFRDAIIATTFLQEIERSPKTPRACLLVFISGDGRIREFLQEKTSSSENVRILSTLDELKSLLNAIASEVTEEFLEELHPKASTVFYDYDKKDGLYMKQKVYSMISDQHSEALKSVTTDYPGSFRKLAGITIGEQTFIKKEGQTVTWNTGVSIGFNVAIHELNESKEKRGLLSISDTEPIILATGESFFSVVWQHQVSAKGNIIKPKINEILFLENSFHHKASP